MVRAAHRKPKASQFDLNQQHTFRLLLKLIDVVLVVYLLFCIDQYFVTGRIAGIYAFLEWRLPVKDVFVQIGMACCWVVLFSRMGLYPQKIVPDRFQWMRSLPLAVTAGVVLQQSGAYLFQMSPFGVWQAGAVWCGALAVFFVYRAMVFGLQALFDKRIIHQILVVGINDRSIGMYPALKNVNTQVRFFDFSENSEGYEKAQAIGASVRLGTLAEFNDDISNQPMDAVIVTLPIRSHYDRIRKIIELCARQGVHVQLAANMFNLKKDVRQFVEADTRMPLIYYATGGYAAQLQYSLKRWIDIVGSVVGMVLLAPVFLAVAAVIFMEDGFPVFYNQERVGLNKRRFRMFKFRTMVVGADKMQASLESYNEYGSGAAFKMTNDPRVIRCGRWLRRTSLDELPQLLNVFLGDMSLVGPRPLPIRDFERFYDDRHRLRFSVKPGMTGLWQVSGRNIIKFEEWMGLDIEYTRNWNLLLDLKILLYTFHVVITGKGAK